MRALRPPPALVPEDLGIKLDEDSEDFTDEEVAGALETTSKDDFVGKAAGLVHISGGRPHYELRRRAGILYCRLLIEGTDASCVFQLPWLRTP